MKPEEIKVGMQVRLEYDSFKGTVLSLPDADGMVEIRFGRGAGDLFRVSELIAVDTVAEKQAATRLQAKIDEAKSAIEKAYAALTEVKQFEDGDGSIDLHLLRDEGLISLQDLERTMNNSGWSSSSLYC